jgi:hypothetical protein
MSRTTTTTNDNSNSLSNNSNSNGDNNNLDGDDNDDNEGWDRESERRGQGSRCRRISSPRYVFFTTFFYTKLMFFTVNINTIYSDSPNMRSLPMPVRFASSSSSSPPDENDYKLRLAKALVDNGSDVLKELLELQNKVRKWNLAPETLYRVSDNWPHYTGLERWIHRTALSKAAPDFW